MIRSVTYLQRELEAETDNAIVEPLAVILKYRRSTQSQTLDLLAERSVEGLYALHSKSARSALEDLAKGKS